MVLVPQMVSEVAMEDPIFIALAESNWSSLQILVVVANIGCGCNQWQPICMCSDQHTLQLQGPGRPWGGTPIIIAVIVISMLIIIIVTSIFTLLYYIQGKMLKLHPAPTYETVVPLPQAASNVELMKVERNATYTSSIIPKENAAYGTNQDHEYETMDPLPQAASNELVEAEENAARIISKENAAYGTNQDLESKL